MTNNTINIFRHNLKYYRKMRKLTQENLSEICGISTDYLSEIERGKTAPSFKRMDMLAQALNIEVYKLFVPIE